MEKILRKVKTSDRLPSINRKDYYTEIGELFFNGRYFESNNRYELLRQPEYWYEEVDVSELISYTDPLVVKRVIEVNNKFAKERYEKALDSYYESKINEGVNASDISHNRLVKALKIAAYGNEI